MFQSRNRASRPSDQRNTEPMRIGDLGFNPAIGLPGLLTLYREPGHCKKQCFNPAIGLPGLLTKKIYKDPTGAIVFQSRNRASRPSDPNKSRAIWWAWYKFQSRNRASRPSDLISYGMGRRRSNKFQSRNRASRPSDEQSSISSMKSTKVSI